VVEGFFDLGEGIDAVDHSSQCPGFDQRADHAEVLRLRLPHAPQNIGAPGDPGPDLLCPSIDQDLLPSLKLRLAGIESRRWPPSPRWRKIPCPGCWACV
jgi:hypothetical protein